MDYLPDVAMVAADTSRTRVYLAALIKNGLLPSFVLLLENREEELLPGQVLANGPATAVSDLQEMLVTACIPFSRASSKDVNDPLVVKEICERPELVFIYSGFGGVLVGKQVLATGKRFLHVHGGYLPDFKGSTTNYFSLLAENTMGASAIFLSAQIDSGPVIHRKKFPPPDERKQIDHVVDSQVRADVLIETLQEFQSTGEWRFDLEENNGGETYYVIHPVLKHIAILAGEVS
jgi:methionyl-tRNA formyltransferase